MTAEELLNAIDPDATMFPSAMQGRTVIKAMEEYAEIKLKEAQHLQEQAKPQALSQQVPSLDEMFEKLNGKGYLFRDDSRGLTNYRVGYMDCYEWMRSKLSHQGTEGKDEQPKTK